eukprot:CAMPEP_0173405556 /NCGR_PEP_ID=MMETSP1356-20130122/62089_1 /TAXON_ID=77927 ORGANISM="Hemiselmis virescens, Strain PCC157" /NCGR_SAMPLE_ID=MMETSP1356 /ASSEMBLY_ACC=CAM_ASM_000847 /LENGTH=91 /DNA_ID=CAMNT_0014366371 /DNA_START=369 /DNA_END=640 /DNA_ORIENTATION=-
MRARRDDGAERLCFVRHFGTEAIFDVGADVLALVVGRLGVVKLAPEAEAEGVLAPTRVLPADLSAAEDGSICPRRCQRQDDECCQQCPRGT